MRAAMKETRGMEALQVAMDRKRWAMVEAKE